MLRLESISKFVGALPHLHSMDLTLEPGVINTLLGATLAGKTSLMRIIAGLDRPSTGRVVDGDRDVTHTPVRQRDLAMVYQQFINYPSLTVRENIASPLQLRGRKASEIRQRVDQIADTLRLTPYLDRLPSELSGGQQQRTALARALAKEAKLLLLDEPLANLDYKLREELRDELTQLFRKQDTTIVYATTEPQEALQLGGRVSILHEGRLIQSGPTIDVFKRPASQLSAQAFSDPPINLFPSALIDISATNKMPYNNASTIGVRAHHLTTVRQTASDVELKGTVDLAEISGSDTYLHVAQAGSMSVAQLKGVHNFTIGVPCSLYFNLQHAFGFDERGALVFAPEHA